MMKLINKETLLQKLAEEGGKRLGELNISSFAAGIEHGLIVAHQIIAEASITKERKTGHWVKKRKRVGGFMLEHGRDKWGNWHEIEVNKRCEYTERYCSGCGGQCADNFLNYYPRCGAKMEGAEQKV